MYAGSIPAPASTTFSRDRPGLALHTAKPRKIDHLNISCDSVNFRPLYNGLLTSMLETRRSRCEQREMTPQDIIMRIRQHELWLARHRDGVRADFSFKDLNGVQLPRVNFRQAKLAGTKITHASLRHADLSEADLYAADLRYTDLFRANLAGADLRGAKLRASNLAFANLKGADMREGGLLNYSGKAKQNIDVDGDSRNCTFNHAMMRNANLTNAQLGKSTFNDADMKGAVLKGAKLKGASMKGADLTAVDFSGASLEGANLSDCKVEGAIFREANLQNTDLRNVDLTEANVTGVDLSNARTGDDGRLKIPVTKPSNLMPDQERIDDMLREHALWVESVGSRGLRADLDNC